MALRFHSQSWQVHDRADGRCVTFADGNVAAATLPALVNELFDLACTSGRQQRSLDPGSLTMPVAQVAGKLIELHDRLHALTRIIPLKGAAKCRLIFKPFAIS